jgi:hypothetical protein
VTDLRWQNNRGSSLALNAAAVTMYVRREGHWSISLGMQKIN